MGKQLWAVAWGAAVLALVAAGCGSSGGGSGPVAPPALGRNIQAVLSGWRARNVEAVAPYISGSYYFNGNGPDLYLVGLSQDFAIMDSVSPRYRVEALGESYAWVAVDYTAYVEMMTSAFGYPDYYERTYTVNTLWQRWIRDLDGVWRINAEYLRSSYALRNTPRLSHRSLLDNDALVVGRPNDVTGTAEAESSHYRAAMWAYCLAAAGSPWGPAQFGWGRVDYEVSIDVDANAYGAYAFQYLGQSDDPSQRRMRGRTLRASYVETVELLTAPRAARPQGDGKPHTHYEAMRTRPAAPAQLPPAPG